SAIQPLDYLLGDVTAAAARSGAESRQQGPGTPPINSGPFGLPMNGGARFGAELDRTGVTFRLWAPAAKRVEVMLDRAHPMQAQAHGWYQTTIPQARPGTLYKYRIDGEKTDPDPSSHFHRQDVSRLCEVIDHGP